MQHALKMYEHIERLNQLGCWMDFELSVDLILASLLDSFAQFVFDYRMNYIVSTIPELVNLLETTESSLRKEKKHVMLVDSSGSKNEKRSKSTQVERGVAEKKAKYTTPKGTCFHCGKVCHWKRNCKVYLESKKKVACDAPSSSGIYVIKVNTISPNNIWVYDTNCGSYIWIDM